MFENTIIHKKDFPYYDANPQLSKTEWFTLLLSLPLSLLGYALFSDISEIIGAIVFCLILLIPLLYFSNWNYKLIFDKIRKEDLKLALKMFMGYIIYATIMLFILNSAGQLGSSEGTSLVVTWKTIVSLVFSIMGEELVKFIPLMFFMRVMYKITKKRRLSLAFSSIIVLTMFGLLHYSPETTIISVLLIQGLGSIFEFYGYFKTKNLFVPYLSHLLTDVVLMILMIIAP